MRKNYFLAAVAAITLLAACSKSSEDLQFPAITDYYPLATGKYITYSLDSTVFTNLGQTKEIHSYQVKLMIDSQITDNLGRKAYRIIRYIRSTPAAAWVPDNTFMAVPADQTIEFVENNLRFIKLKEPLRDGFAWKGNKYIDTYSSGSTLKYMDDWDYTYDSLNLSAKIGSLNFDSTVTVHQQDAFYGTDPVSVPNSVFAQKDFSAEKYAKGIGLIYRNFLHWEYQHIPGGMATYEGYGVLMKIIDHN